MPLGSSSSRRTSQILTAPANGYYVFISYNNTTISSVHNILNFGNASDEEIENAKKISSLYILYNESSSTSLERCVFMNVKKGDKCFLK